ncbi:YjgN family protein [Nitrospira sp. M1]
MDATTELTCPECGERQTQTDECISCGAGLFSLEEDVPVITGEKTTSAPWPSSSSSTTPSAFAAATEPVLNTQPPESHTPTSIEDSPQVEEHSQVGNQSTTTPDWQPTTMSVDPPVIATAHASSENGQQQDNPTHSEALLTIEQTESIENPDSSHVDEESNDEPPIPIAPTPEHPISSDRIRHPVFWGNGRSLFGIFIVNSFLTIITLGIYSFWGRARVRAFLNSQTSFASSRFAYHGTGKELFTGWMKAMLVFGIPYLSLSALPFFWKQVPPYIPQGIAGLLFLCFIPVAVVGAHRYRMSRTSLRNIRFSFRGTVSDYTKLWLKGSVLTALTLGLYYPFFENARRHYLITHSQFGSQTFDYEGTGKDLFAIYTKSAVLYLMTITLASSIVLAVITVYLSMPLSDMTTLMFASSALPFIAGIGLIVPWFYLQAARQCFFWNHTIFGEARFFSTVTAWKIFELRLGHLFLLVSTLGMAWPWVQVRNLQFFYYYTELDGPLDLHLIEQDALDASPTGEELAGFFDTGFDLG